MGRRFQITLFGFLGFLLICISGLAQRGAERARSSSHWIAQRPMSVARQGACAASLLDGRVLVTGGSDANESALSSAELFNADQGFSPVTSMYTGRTGHVCAMLPGGSVMVAGGIGPDGSTLSSAQVFDPAFGTWRSAGSMTVPRSGATASLMKGGKVLIAGGQSFSVASSSLEVFDPVSRTFSAVIGTMSSPRYQHAAAVLSDGRVLVAGGSNGTAVLDSIDIYDPDTQAARPAGRLMAPRQGLSATTMANGQILIAGGTNGSAELASAEIFNPIRGTVQAAGSMSSARQGHLAFRLPHNNEILLAGGAAAGAPIASSEVYIPWAGAFQPIESLSIPRAQALGAATGRTGLLLVAGGRITTGGASLTAEALSYATVMTDQSDYSPGQTVTITGTGWQPGETVQLVLHETPAVEPDQTLTANADASGNILNTEFKPDSLDVGITFTLTATGLTSGLQAQTTFTDAVFMTPPTFSTSSGGPFVKGTQAHPFIALYGQTPFITTAPPAGITCPTATFNYALAGTPPAPTTLLPGTSANTSYPTSFTTPPIGAYQVAVAPDTSCSSSVGGSDPSFFTINGTISGVIYIDVNCNGVFDSGTDLPLPGVTVTLGTDSAVSAADGSFTLSKEAKVMPPGATLY